MSKIKTEMIIDCSGSMQPNSSQVNEGVAEYAKSMKDGDWTTITEFDGGQIVQERHQATKKDFGSTPYAHRACSTTNLYDAVGSVLSRLLTKKTCKGRALVITTDGYENASKEFTGDQIRKMIKKFEKRGGAVMYISASENPFADAAVMGISHKNTAAYDKANTRATYSVAADAKERLRTGGTKAMAFSDNERTSLTG